MLAFLLPHELWPQSRMLPARPPARRCCFLGSHFISWGGTNQVPSRRARTRSPLFPRSGLLLARLGSSSLTSHSQVDLAGVPIRSVIRRELEDRHRHGLRDAGEHGSCAGSHECNKKALLIIIIVPDGRDTGDLPSPSPDGRQAGRQTGGNREGRRANPRLPKRGGARILQSHRRSRGSREAQAY